MRNGGNNTLKEKIRIAFGLVIVVMFTVAVCGFGCKEQAPQNKVELTFWNLWDDSDVFQSLISEYQTLKPWVKINYYKKTYDEYEELLTNAMLAGKGPDIFTIHNTWFAKRKDILASAPSDLIEVGDYRNAFADVAVSDFVKDNKIYAVPFSIDTLALYYNKDFFNSANIPYPPQTWNDFKSLVKKMTLFDESGNIIRSGVAMGTAENVNRAVDVLSLLMLQQGSEIVDEANRKVTFNSSLKASDGSVINPGLDSLKFYTNFANPFKDIYTWNSSMDYSIDAFAYSKAAMMFGYSYHSDLIKFKSPGLNFGVSEMPQISESSKKVNYANYWGEAVYSGSTHQREAWEFLLFLSKKESLKKYLDKTGKPTSRRDMVFDRTDNEKMKIFDSQILSAKSWYQVNNIAIENYFADMIELVIQKKMTEELAVKQAADQIELLMRNY